MRPNEHFLIPDTQCKPGGKVNHLRAAGNYVVYKQPNVIVHLGDHWDMPSISSHDGALTKENARYWRDIQAGKRGMEAFLAPIKEYNSRRRKKYQPRMVFLLGNHEQRIERYVQAHPETEEVFTYKHFGLREEGWEVIPFLKPICIDGVTYAHYFYNPENGKTYGGKAPSVLNSLGFSFSQGHKQGKDIASKALNNGRMLRGLIAGSFYQHDEKYKGPQANDHWRGCIYKHQVHRGDYDLMEVSLNYLLREWT